MIGAEACLLSLEGHLSKDLPFHFPKENTSVLVDTFSRPSGHPLQLLRLETVEMTQAKTRRFLDIPAVGGYLDEYWEVDMGDEVLMIQKPKDPLADWRELGKGIKETTLDEAMERLHIALTSEFQKRKSAR
jgi:hypothetical protein